MGKSVHALLDELRRRDDVTFLELRPEPPEVVTFGFTDAQIRALPVETLNAQIAQSQRLAASLKQQAQDTDARTAGLRSVLRRKHALTQEK